MRMIRVMPAGTWLICRLSRKNGSSRPRDAVAKQLRTIGTLLSSATEVIHAGDPDREGQLLVDEVLDFLELAPEKRQQVQRCLVNDLNPQAVTRAVDKMRLNRDFIPLCVFCAGPGTGRLALRHQYDTRLHHPRP